METSSTETLEQIVEEIEKMSETERQMLLIKLRAISFRRSNKSISRYGKSVKPLSMGEIDKIKHVSRK